VVLLFSTFLLTSCNNPKEVSKENFRRIINEHLKNKGLYIALEPTIFGETSFPLVLEKGRFADFDTKINRFSALESAGLVVIEDTTFKKEKSSMIPAWAKEGEDRFYKVNTKKITLTKLGSKYLAKVNTSMLRTKGFKFGIAKVNEITEYTKPATMMGRKVTSVQFNKEARKIYDWAKNEAIINEFDNIKQYINSNKNPIKDKTTLVLTNEGWKYPEG